MSMFDPKTIMEKRKLLEPIPTPIPAEFPHTDEVPEGCAVLTGLKDEWGIGIASSDVTAAEERTFYSYIGSSDAPYTGGLINTFSYKNWELNVNFLFDVLADTYVRSPLMTSSIRIMAKTIMLMC